MFRREVLSRVGDDDEDAEDDALLRMQVTTGHNKEIAAAHALPRGTHRALMHGWLHGAVLQEEFLARKKAPSASVVRLGGPSGKREGLARDNPPCTSLHLIEIRCQTAHVHVPKHA